MNTFEIAQMTGFKHEVVLRQVKKYFSCNQNVVEGEAHHDCNNQTHIYFELPDPELAYYAIAMDDVKLCQKILAKTCGVFTNTNDSWDAMTSILDIHELNRLNFNQLKAKHRLLCRRVEHKLVELGFNPKDYGCRISIEGSEVDGYELPPDLNFVFAHGVLKRRGTMIEFLTMKPVGR